MAASLYPPSLLDADQIIQHVYDEPTQTLRTSGVAVITPPPGGLEVAIDHTDDSIAIGTSTDLFTSTTDGSKIALDVNVINPNGTIFTSVNDFNEVTAVASGVLTTINIYTVPALTSAKIQRIAVSGTNIAKYEVLVNGSLIDRMYTYFSGGLSALFELEDTNLVAGDVILVRVLHDRPDVGDFNARIQAEEYI